MQPNTTLAKPKTEIHPYKFGVFDQWITFLALGGLLVDEEDGHIYKMTLTEFCEKFGVARSTAAAWKNYTKDLPKLIEARRNEISPQARVSAVFNQLFLMSMQSQDKRAAVDAQKTFLGHFGNLQLPVQRQDIKVQGGLLEVLKAAETDGIIEGEIIEPIDINARASDQAPSALSATP